MVTYTKRPGFAREIATTAYIPELDASRVQIVNGSLFGEVKTVSRYPLIELNSVFGTSTLRDVVTTANGGTKDDINGTITTGEIELETNTTINGSAILESADVGRYVPGYGAEIGMGIRLPAAPTGTTYAKWGGVTSDGNHGFHFGYDSTGIYVARTVNGTETDATYQANWNLDNLDGTGLSGVTLTPSNGNIYQIEFSWYGYGQIIFGILANIDGKQTYVPCHQMSGFSTTSVQNPALRLRQEVNNGASSTTNFQMYVGGRQYSIAGNYRPLYRYTGDIRSSVTVGTTTLPLISFRSKTGFEDRSLKLASFDIINNGTNDVYAEIRMDGSLTAASFGTPTSYTAADTALESDTSATAISGGSVIWSGTLVPAGVGGGAGLSSQDLQLDLPSESTFTLCATSFSGTSACLSSFQMREEW